MKRVFHLFTLFLGGVLFLIMIAVSAAVLAALVWSMSYAIGSMADLTLDQVEKIAYAIGVAGIIAASYFSVDIIKWSWNKLRE